MSEILKNAIYSLMKIITDFWKDLPKWFISRNQQEIWRSERSV